MATKVKLVADGVITPDQITLTTASTGTNTTAPATTAFVQQEISALVDSSPDALNTLNELAAALGDDANFSTTVTNSIATKLPLAGGTLTGALTMSVSPTINNARLLVQRANDDSSITFANNASGTPSSHTWAIGLDYSASNGLSIAYSASGLPSLTGNNLVQIDTTGTVGIGTTNPSGSGLHIKKDTSATTNELLRLSNSAGSTTDGVKLVMEVANTSGNGGEIGTVRDSGSFNPYMYFSTSAGVGSSPTEKMRIDSSGRVGIGTDSPQTSTKGLHVVHDANEGTPSFPSGEVIIAQRNFNSSQGCHIGIIGGSASDSAINFGDKDNSDAGIIRYHHNGDFLGFTTNTTEHWKMFANGSFQPTQQHTKDIGGVNAEVRNIYAQGLYVGGSAAANALDDYEEGTWTPASGTTGITIQGTPSGTYTKIGRMVYYTMSLKCNRTGSGSAQVTFTGLPFSGTGGILQFTRFEPTGIAYQWINGSTSGTIVYLTRPAGTAPGSSGGTNNNAGQVLKVDDISSTTNAALQNVSAYGWYSV